MSFNIDEVLSIARIRSHTKTDDTAYVTDDLLSIYRGAALEAAELYTGLLFGPLRTITENVTGLKARYGKQFAKFELRYPSADGFIYYRSPERSGTVQVSEGETEIRLPVISGAIVDDCCAPCGSNLYNIGMVITYQAGIKCAADIPSGIILGCLKFIAWSVQNAGDELVTMAMSKTNTGISQVGVAGTNNVAWASGALELWRQYRLKGF